MAGAHEHGAMAAEVAHRHGALVTRVSVPSQRSTVSQRVPRTVAWLWRPCVRKLPPLSRPHSLRTLRAREADATAPARARRLAPTRGQLEKRPPRR